MRAIRAVILDFEGTIGSVEGCHTKGFSIAAASYGISISPEEFLLIPGYVGAGDQGVTKMLCARFNRPDIDQEEFKERKKAEYNRLLKTVKFVMRPGCEHVFSQIKRNLLEVSVVSLTPTEQALPLIEGFKLERLIPRERIILLEDVRETKPNPEAVYKAAEKMECKPEEIIVFGDGMKDMQLAKNAGAIGIGMPCNISSFKELMDAGAYTVFRSWEHINFEGLLHTIQFGEE